MGQYLDKTGLESVLTRLKTYNDNTNTSVRTDAKAYDVLAAQALLDTVHNAAAKNSAKNAALNGLSLGMSVGSSNLTTSIRNSASTFPATLTTTLTADNGAALSVNSTDNGSISANTSTGAAITVTVKKKKTLVINGSLTKRAGYSYTGYTASRNTNGDMSVTSGTRTVLSSASDAATKNCTNSKSVTYNPTDYASAYYVAAVDNITAINSITVTENSSNQVTFKINYTNGTSQQETATGWNGSAGTPLSGKGSVQKRYIFAVKDATGANPSKTFQFEQLGQWTTISTSSWVNKSDTSVKDPDYPNYQWRLCYATGTLNCAANRIKVV